MSLAEGVILKIAMSILLNDEQTAMQIFWAELFDDIGTGPLDEDDVIEAAANWMDQLYANVAAMIADSVSGAIVEVWEVDEPTGDISPIGDGFSTWDGGSGNDAMPNGVAAIGALKTTDTKVTGRKFIPGINEGAAVDNNLNVDALAKLVDFVVDWQDTYVDPNDVGLLPGVYSGVQQNFFLASGTVIANEIVGYQRRRKPGVGS